MQYCLVIYYQDEIQYEMVKYIIVEMVLVWDVFIVIELLLLQIYYCVEDYYQNYFVQYFFQGYCVFVVVFKVVKLCEVFVEKSKLE